MQCLPLISPDKNQGNFMNNNHKESHVQDL